MLQPPVLTRRTSAYGDVLRLEIRITDDSVVTPTDPMPIRVEHRRTGQVVTGWRNIDPDAPFANRVIWETDVVDQSLPTGEYRLHVDGGWAMDSAGNTSEELTA